MSTAPPGHASPTGSGFPALIVVGGLLRIPATLLAALFLGAVQRLDSFFWHQLPQPLGLPVLGALIVPFAYTVLAGTRTRCSRVTVRPRPLEGLSSKPTPASHEPGDALAALGTLPFRAVLGPEAPVIALGSVVGMAANRIPRVDVPRWAVLPPAGSFSALSALLGGSIAAGLLLAEGSLARLAKPARGTQPASAVEGG